MKYDIVLLDADGTLFDFEAAAEAAFGATSAEFIPGLDAPALFSRYHEINDVIWAELERGEIGKEELKVERFRRLFADEAYVRAGGRPGVDPAAFSARYLDLLSRQAQLIPGAAEFVRRLAATGARLALATNGISAVQRGRHSRSPFAELIPELLISEELGAEKPSPDYFRAAFLRLGVEAGGGIAFVGDSWNADVEGALGAGLDAVWFNPKGKTPPRSVESVVEATSYGEVLAALGVEG